MAKRAEGQNSPQDAPKYIVNKKSHHISLFFGPESYSGGLLRPFRGREYPQDKFM